MLYRASLLIFTLTLLSSSFVFAGQDSLDVEIVRVELKDGSTLIGEIQNENDQNLEILTLSKLKINIPKEQIESRKVISQSNIVKGELWLSDPNSTRLLFAPTGRALKAGHGYFSAYEIFFPFIAIGLTDYITLAGGMSLIPGADRQLFYFAPKVTPIRTKNFDLSGGVLYISVPGADKGAGIAYGVGTFGNEKTAFTFGTGFGFVGGDFADNPVLVFGGELRASRYIKLITENWIFVGGEFNMLSGAIRFFGENLAADFGLFYPTGASDGFPFIPWLGFVYNFSGDKKRR